MVPIESPRGRLTTVAALGFLLLAASVVWAALHGGHTGLLRGHTELGLAALGVACVLSYALPVPSGSHPYHRVIQLAAVLFTVGLAVLGLADLREVPPLVPLGSGLLGAGYLVAAAALAVYLKEHLSSQWGATYLADVVIVVISTVALVAPLVVGPLTAEAGLRGLVAGTAWTAELGLVLAATWAVAAWVGPRAGPELMALLWTVIGGLALGSAHVILVLLGHPSFSWWLAMLYAPAILMLTYAPQLSSRAGQFRDLAPVAWSLWQSYLPYGPAALLLLVGLGLAAVGASAPEARATVAGALLVSGLVMSRQFVLLRDHRGLLGRRSVEALHDPLTGLLNRRAFDSELDAHCERARRDGTAFLLVLVDLDRLKAINDGPGGHRAGDRALRSTATALAASVRADDRTYRLGGDEFAALISAPDRGLGEAVLGRARLALTGLAPGVTFSSGVALAPVDGAQAAVVFAAADRCLYRSKRERLEPARGPLGGLGALAESEAAG